MSKTNKKDPVRKTNHHAVSNHIITHLYYYYTNTNYSDQTEMKRRKKETYYSSLLNLLFLKPKFINLFLKTLGLDKARVKDIILQVD